MAERALRKTMNKADPSLRKYYTKQDQMNAFFKDKRVVIVGPAGYLKNQSEFINNHDIVVRVNRCRPNPKHTGNRTDVLFNFITELWEDYFIEQQPFLQDGLKMIVTTTALPMYYKKFRQKLKVPSYLIPYSEYRSLYGKLASKPNTGTVAIWYLLKTELKCLNVVGMDFYASGYYPGYGGDGEVGSHDFDLQSVFLKTLQEDERLHFDEAMKNRIKIAETLIDDISPLPKMSVVIPYGKSDEHRENVMKWTIERIQTVFPEFQICIGENSDVPFNRAKAKNNGIKKATHDLVLIMDADALFRRKMVHDALDQMHKEGKRWIRAGGRSFRITKESTESLLKQSGHLQMHLETEGLYATNFFCIVERSLLKQTGGYDEKFKDWGGEDFAFFKTLGIWSKEGTPIRSKIFHIWHETSPQSEIHMKALRKRDMRIPTVKRHWQYHAAQNKNDITRIRGMGK